ncbi:hypothetical protein HanLR1_Chr08g0277861 [Helianthus annuus]|nr:hypothetical protein HanHA89_Chr08g0296291 [Helianthus annuus]KAJ0719088.1 hypothetical protein HanLR1_Chr08g0277861 [Helianthus annuus]
MNLAPHSNFNLSLSFILAVISLLLKCIALMIEPVNLHIQFFVPISLFQHRCFMEALFHTLTFDLGFAYSVCSYAITAFCTSQNFSNIIVATSLRRAVGSSSALFLKSEVQKVEYFFMINEEVNVEDQVYEDRATVQELKRCFGDIFLHFGIQKQCRSFSSHFTTIIYFFYIRVEEIYKLKMSSYPSVGSYDLKYRFIKEVEDQVYEDRATVQELKIIKFRCSVFNVIVDLSSYVICKF